MKGMYKNVNYKANAKCLDAETQGYFVDFFLVITPNAPDTTWGNAIVSLQSGLLHLSDWCDFDEALYGYLTFSYNTDNTAPTYMLQALMKKVFQLTTVGNDFVQIFMEGMPKATDSELVISSFFDRIGSNLGKILRYATDFDPTLYPLVQN